MARAAERFELEPVLLGALFEWRGSGSWSQTPTRAENIAEVEARARRYGLPPLVWPDGWPVNGLRAMRAATWAKSHGGAAPFARAVFHREFATGADISDPRVLAHAAEEVDLDPQLMLAALDDPAIKQRLKDATGAAWEAGVRGVPTVVDGDTVLYGDDVIA